MRVLVTGADGLLGTNIVRYLLEKGAEVRVFIMKNSASTTLMDLPIQTFYGNILDIDSLDLAFENTDYVIHVAASTKIYPAKNEMVRRINVQGTKNVVSACEKHNIKKLIFIGSGSSYAPTENSIQRTFGLDYIQSKMDALRFIQDKTAKNNFPATTILPTFMIGAYDYYAGSGKMTLSVASGKLKIYAPGGKNFVSVRSVAMAAVHAIEKGAIGQAYLVSGKNLLFKEYFQLVAEVSQIKPPNISIPKPIILLVGYLGQIAQFILRKEMLINKPIAQISCIKQFVPEFQSTEALSIPVISVEEAISDSIDWFKKNIYLS